MSKIDNDWLVYLQEEYKKPYYKDLYTRVRQEYTEHLVFPPADDIFNAFHYTPLSDVRVVILGQDPYHTPGAACGLAFSVPQDQPVPPSLVNIYKELHDELGCDIPNNGDLRYWAGQGVLLLNTVLTVRAHEAASHRGIGWEEFTDAVIRTVDSQERPIVFLLWGSPAAKKESLLTNKSHLVLKAPHPSPLSAYRGFFGCGHFKKANEYLAEHGEKEIDWQIKSV